MKLITLTTFVVLGVVASCASVRHRHLHRSRSHRRRRSAGPNLGGRCSALLVARAAEDRGGVGCRMPRESAGRFIQPGLSFGFLAIWAQATPQYLIGAWPRRCGLLVFVPNFQAELGLALMFASMIPIYWRAERKRA